MTDQLENKVQPVALVCPVMSTVARLSDPAIELVPTITGNKAVNLPPQTLVMYTPCVRGQCALWDYAKGHCGLMASLAGDGVPALLRIAERMEKLEEHADNVASALGRLANSSLHLKHLEPARDSKPPLTRIGDLLEEWIALLKERKVGKP